MKLQTVFLVAVMVLFAASQALSQTVLYEYEAGDNGNATNFTRIVSKNCNAYMVSPKKGRMLSSLQIGYPVSLLGGLTIGAGAEGWNGFDEFSFGFWGKKTIWENENWQLSFLVGKSTCDIHGEYLIRWFFPLAYKNGSLAPNLFRSRQSGKTVNDFGMTAEICGPLIKMGVNVTYWFERHWWWFTVKKSF